MTERFSDLMKDNAGNAWELRIPRAGRKDIVSSEDNTWIIMKWYKLTVIS